ncbi:MAG: hypothetical protein ABL997_05245 [Planctomycetota bacterium]
MTSSARRTTFLSFALAVLSAASAPGQDEKGPYEKKPSPAGPDAYTHKEFTRDRTHFWRALLLTDCKATGALAEPWQQDLEAMIEKYAAIYGTYTPAKEDYDRFYAAQEKLERAGCELPLLLLAKADARRWQRRDDEAAAPLEMAAAAASKHTPGFRLLLAISQQFLLRRGNDEDAKRQVTDRALQALVDVAASEGLPKGAERFLLEHIIGQLGTIGANSVPFLELLEQRSGADHFLVLVLRSKYHNRLALDARGQGTASSVNEKDFRTFAEHMEKAAEFGSRAAKRYPHYPEGPTAVMEAIGPFGAETEDLRRWLDIAVAAQFDWTDAYLTYLHYVQPRWGGSQRELIAFGTECVETGRFDTPVPSLYRIAIQYVTLDSREPLTIWARSSVQKWLEKIVDGQEAAAVTQRDRWHANTHRVVALALDDRCKEAAALYENWQQQIDPGQLSVYDVDEDWLKKTLRPFLSDYHPAEIVGEDLFRGFEDAPGFDRAQPLDSHRDAKTAAQIQSEWQDWLDTSFASAYREFGIHDDAWDADADTLLKSFGRIAMGKATATEADLAGKLSRARCTDPLVQYVIVRTLKNASLQNRIGRLHKLLPELEKRYPQTFPWWGKHHTQELLRELGRKDLAGALYGDIKNHVIRATADAMCAGNGRRKFVIALYSGSFLSPGEQLLQEDEIAQLAALEGADPWLVHFVSGHHHAHRAKYPNGAQIDRARDLKAAAEHLRAAWQSNPEIPEAATLMIVVAGLDAEVAGGTPREWFDRAVRAQIDYWPACDAFLDTLRPSRGGSLAAMFRFAVECLDSGRYDTATPMWFASIVQRMQDERSGAREVWAAKGVGERLDRLFAGYLASEQGPFDASVLHAGRVTTAWAAGRYDHALAAWREAGEKIDPQWLELCRLGDIDLIESDLRFLAEREKK